MLIVHSRWSPFRFRTVKNSHRIWRCGSAQKPVSMRFNALCDSRSHCDIFELFNANASGTYHSRIASKPTNQSVKFIVIVLTNLWCHRNVFMWFEGSDSDRQAELDYFFQQPIRMLDTKQSNYQQSLASCQHVFYSLRFTVAVCLVTRLLITNNYLIQLTGGNTNLFGVLYVKSWERTWK